MRSIESKVPGFYDVLDEESQQLRQLDSIFIDVAGTYGFTEIHTTAIELRERYLAAATVHPSKIFEVHRPKEGTRFALKADLAIGMSRFVADLPSPLPLKLAEVSSLFRDRQPNRPGYRREFRQAVLGTWGVASSFADAEVVAAAYDVLTRIPGVQPAFIQISNHQILNRVAPGLAQALRSGEAGADALRGLDLSARDRQVLTELFGRDRVPLAELLDLATGAEDARVRDEVSAIEDVANGVTTWFPSAKIYFSLSDLHGVGYYSGVSHQIFVTATERDQPFSIADGGRIDQLCGILNGVKVPAVCTGIGLTVLGRSVPAPPGRRRVIILVGDDSPDLQIAGEVRSTLNDGGVIVSILPLPRRRWSAVLRSQFYLLHGFVLIEGTRVSVRHDDNDERRRIEELLATRDAASPRRAPTV